jgi:hypothetical protein
MLIQPRTDKRCAPASAGSRCNFAVLLAILRRRLRDEMVRGQKKAPCHSQVGANLLDWKIWRGARHEGSCIRTEDAARALGMRQWHEEGPPPDKRRWCGQGTGVHGACRAALLPVRSGIANVGYSSRATETLAEDGNRRVSAAARRSQRCRRPRRALTASTTRPVATPRERVRRQHEPRDGRRDRKHSFPAARDLCSAWCGGSKHEG